MPRQEGQMNVGKQGSLPLEGSEGSWEAAEAAEPAWQAAAGKDMAAQEWKSWADQEFLGVALSSGNSSCSCRSKALCMCPAQKAGSVSCWNPLLPCHHGQPRSMYRGKGAICFLGFALCQSAMRWWLMLVLT